MKDIIPQFVKKYIPQQVKDFFEEPSRLKHQRDVEKFRRDGTRFAPPLQSFPPMVLLDTTTRCNLHCAHCPHSILSAERGFLGDMDRDLYFRVIDEIASEALNTLVRPFNSGEPLMRKDIAELIGYAKRKGIHSISITTNGTLLSGNRRRDLIESGLDDLEVSIDATTAETYLKIRKSPLFDRVVGNTIAYIEESKAYNPGSTVAVSFVLQSDNQHELNAFKQFWEGKADKVYIRQYHQHNNLIDDHGHFRQKHYRFRHPCPYLWDRIIVNHDGKVRFCEADWKALHGIGNVQTQTIKEIWHGEVYQKLRKQHIEGTFDYPYCKTCSDWREITWPGMRENAWESSSMESA